MQRIKLAPSTAGQAAWAAELLTVLFLAIVVACAKFLAVPFLLFPELAALAGDVFLRPAGKWAKEPWKLIVTPTTTAFIGLLISSHMPYGVLPIVLSMLISLIVIRILNSAVSPAISAGALPIVLGIQSWLYPACILCTLAALVLVLLVWRRTAWATSLATHISTGDEIIELLETPPQSRWWLLSLTIFVIGIGAVAQISQWRFILFPPLIVIAYEMLGHTETCPWAKRPFSFPLICFLAALLGVGAARWLGTNPIAAVLVLIGTFSLLRLGRLRLPPALAIGLIPFILPVPKFEFAYSVGIGTSALTVWFLANVQITRFTTEHSMPPPAPSP